VRDTTRRRLTRVTAPAAFLVAATAAILLVRPALDDAEPTTTPAAATTRTATAQTTTRPAGTARSPRFVRVGRGDTLESIARRAGTTVESLLTLNPQIDPVALRVGQRVRVR
jgi:LysM repeat protein